MEESPPSAPRGIVAEWVCPRAKRQRGRCLSIPYWRNSCCAGNRKRPIPSQATKFRRAAIPSCSNTRRTRGQSRLSGVNRSFSRWGDSIVAHHPLPLQNSNCTICLKPAGRGTFATPSGMHVIVISVWDTKEHAEATTRQDIRGAQQPGQGAGRRSQRTSLGT